jgi:glutamate-1-semialdehyde 2,1-aminomutase
MRSQFPQNDFLAKVAARCRAAGAVFVVDEVTSGLRFGFPGAMPRLGVEPDIAVYAKAMSNGFPFAAIVGKSAIMTSAEGSFISSSYWTDGVGPAAALAVLEKSQRLKVHDVVWSRGEKLQAELRKLAERHPLCKLTVGGMPAAPTMGFNLGDDTPLAQTLYVRKMRERGVLVGSCYYVMLAHEDAHVAQLLEAMAAVLPQIERIITEGKLAEESGVPRGQRGFARLA